MSKGQQLLLAKPMFVPVIGAPAKVTAALAAGSVELVGPFQKRSAFVTVPLTPATVIVPVPAASHAPKAELGYVGIGDGELICRSCRAVGSGAGDLSIDVGAALGICG